MRAICNPSSSRPAVASSSRPVASSYRAVNSASPAAASSLSAVTSSPNKPQKPTASTSDVGVEVNVCTSKACKRQGSPQVLKFVEDFALPGVSVASCGCLGGCGKGPNLMIVQEAALSPEHRCVMLSHVSTPRDAADALRSVCGISISENDLKALQARLLGNQLALDGKLEEAVVRYTEGLGLEPRTGAHLLLCNRSAALLQLGRKEQALEDACKALELSPPGFAKAWIRTVDSYYALGMFKEAAETTQQAIKDCPSFSTLPQFKDICAALKQAGCAIRIK